MRCINIYTCHYDRLTLNTCYFMVSKVLILIRYLSNNYCSYIVFITDLNLILSLISLKPHYNIFSYSVHLLKPNISISVIGFNSPQVSIHYSSCIISFNPFKIGFNCTYFYYGKLVINVKFNICAYCFIKIN